MIGRVEQGPVDGIRRVVPNNDRISLCDIDGDGGRDDVEIGGVVGGELNFKRLKQARVEHRPEGGSVGELARHSDFACGIQVVR